MECMLHFKHDCTVSVSESSCRKRALSPTCLPDVSTSSNSCRSWPRLCIAGKMKLLLAPGSSPTTVCLLPGPFSSHLPLLLTSLPDCAAELALSCLPVLAVLLAGVLVTGGPLLPYSVTKRAAWVAVAGWLHVTTVTCRTA